MTPEVQNFWLRDHTKTSKEVQKRNTFAPHGENGDKN
jgi:hypothetical protein